MEPLHRLTIVGLGPGDPAHLSTGVAELLRSHRVLLRTRHHPVARQFAGSERWESCDDLYETASTFEEVYDRIVARVIDRAREGSLVYAVPGHPLVGEATVRRLLTDAPAHGISCAIVPGLSFIDAALALLGIDALAANLQIVDALELASCAEAAPFGGGSLPLSPLRPALVGQLYDRILASAVKLALERLYPADTTVVVIAAAGTSTAHVARFPLYELDHRDYDATTALYLPPLDPLDAPVTEALQRVVARLRAPDGCPWDREQTHRSLRRHLLEETYEALEAIDHGDDDALREELGDVLLQVLMHAQIAEERGAFVYEEVVGSVIEKLVRRHPHVFGQSRAESASQVLARWEQIKAAERAGKPRRHSMVPRTLPALARAQELLERLQRVRPERLDELGASAPRSAVDTERSLLARLVPVLVEAVRLGINLEFVVRTWSDELERELVDWSKEAAHAEEGVRDE
ncbi:MAG: MazG family protein [Thermomicrobium sp.]|nr:MazG family protein [Thermomicrobium sp.]MDW8058939.1 MazG family protein [Thermomicrobium sp.]